MLNVQTAESIISIITFLLAYLCSVTFAGFFTAWMALQMGDDTPEQEGFLTLNPLAHIDFLGTLFLVLYNFGWGRFVPINPFNIHGPYRTIKVLAAFSAKSFAHCMLGIISLICLLALFGETILVSPLPLAQTFPQSSSYTLSIGLVLIAMLIVNVLLAIITFLVNMCGLVVMIWAEKHPEYLMYTSLIMLIVPVAVFYLCGGILFAFVFGLIKYIGYLIASLLHLF